MIRGSGMVTGIVCLGSVAGFGAGTGPVGELWSLWVRPLSCSSSQRPAVQVEAGRCTHLWRRLGQWLGWAKQRASPRRIRGTSPATRRLMAITERSQGGGVSTSWVFSPVSVAE